MAWLSMELQSAELCWLLPAGCGQEEPPNPAEVPVQWGHPCGKPRSWPSPQPLGVWGQLSAVIRACPRAEEPAGEFLMCPHPWVISLHVGGGEGLNHKEPMGRVLSWNWT